MTVTRLTKRARRRIFNGLGVWALLCAAATGCGGAESGARQAAALATDCASQASDHATSLQCTGLYADFARGTLADGVFEFAPSESLWSDGAGKRRFIYVPPNTKIDTSDMNAWVFPVGTKLWKEFSVDGSKVETRHLEKRADGSWFRTTYVWSDDQSAAVEVTTGVPNLRGTGFDVPPQTECSLCHDGAADGVLGFEAIGLSGSNATGLTMAELVRRGLLTAPPSSPPVIPGAPLDVAALGWLHANCGNSCHNATPKALASGTGLRMRLRVEALDSVQDTDTFRTAVGVPSGFQPAPDAGFDRITPGDPAHSAIPLRAGTRASTGPAGWKMPPIATNVPDVPDVDVLNAWIESL